MKNRDEIKAAFEVAVRFAIEQMGKEEFKKTSFFGSSEKAVYEHKMAA